MRGKIIFATSGKMLLVIGTSMALPLMVALYYGEKETKAFLISMLITLICGALLSFGFKNNERMRIKDGYLIVTLSWILATLFGMLPYLISGAVDTLPDAIFETMSGFTTTGASIFTDVEALGKGILLWRALTHWLGDVGILVLFVALLSALGNNGMQLFKAEISQAVGNKLTPRISDGAKILWIVYMVLTVVAIAGYWLCGMDMFDAICHSFATVATGGFSTKNSSLGYYQNAGIEWVGIIVMFLSGINLALYYDAWRAKHKLQGFFKNSVVKAYLLIYGFLIAVLSCQLFLQQDLGVHDAVRTAAFQVITIGTTTGFVTTDFECWSQMSKYILVLAMMIGGCAGSTSGGIKVDRFVIAFEQVKIDIQRILHPRLVGNVKSSSYPMDTEGVARTLTFIFIYLITLAIGIFILVCLDLSILDAYMAAITSLGNIGAVWGSFGPSECYAAFPQAGKILMSILMLLGRLEIYTVFAAILPERKIKK